MVGAGHTRSRRGVITCGKQKQARSTRVAVVKSSGHAACEAIVGLLLVLSLVLVAVAADVALVVAFALIQLVATGLCLASIS